MEALRLRVKDVDLIVDQITVRDGKGEKDRVTMRKYPRAAAEWGWHASLKTTMIYTHVLNRGGRGVRSPIDLL